MNVRIYNKRKEYLYGCIICICDRNELLRGWQEAG